MFGVSTGKIPHMSIRTYPPGQWPDVEVLVDATWCAGELRSWKRTPHGWVAQVRWRRGPGQGNYVGSFPADQVREV